MWSHPTYRPDSPEAALALISRRPFGTVLAGDRISHLPFVVEPGTATTAPALAGHVPLADPIAAELTDGAAVTVVFSWPAAYVSPSWYASPGLPTYNFVAVHVRGRAVAMASPDELRSHLDDLVRAHESGRPDPWSPDDAARRRTSELIGYIAGFRVRIDDVAAKTKLGQNRSAADRRRVAEHLANTTETETSVLAEYMRALDAS